MAEANIIGPYRVLEPLGRGGMGVVFRARHQTSERAIALKTVEVPATKWIDSIRREIQALTRIRHPGIVRIVDHGVHQGRPWYAMDLVEGESLRSFGQRLWSPFRRLTTPIPSTEQLTITEEVCSGWADTAAAESETRRIPVDDLLGGPPAAAGELTRVLQMMRRICASLAFLHGEGFLNCDLKPENVLLVGEQPVIIDFGLTTHHPGGSGREALEAQRGLSGTWPYMSPEQIRGEFLDARSDLYAVGCMLYELVTGAPPFTGAPRIIIKQHLTEAPRRPSELVTGVSRELEQLILKLLEKNLTDRYGYADEVAGELAELCQDARRLTDYPPSRSYLYRPRFVGREPIVRRLTELRERAASGSGSLVIVGGESGVGKTRLAMELTRFLPITQMRVVTSEASALAVESAAAVAPAPLHALRSLLQAVADRCQEGGEGETEFLLGHRRSVLAMYEPLLAHVPASEPLPPIMPLSAEASRQRLFKYLAETLAAFVQEQPLMWVLDDLGWADELSLAFLQSLTADYLDSHAILILGAYRTEEPSEAITALTRLPHVTHIELPRLENKAVRAMIGDMLALREPLDGFTDFVSAQAEGNPFFVAEYLRNAVSERLLHRNHKLAWQLDGTRSANDPNYESLGLPHSLLALIEHRLRKLSPAAQQVGLAAAVLGRESNLETLRDVSDLAPESCASAIDELIRRQVLEQPEPESVRFAHDKLREVTYSQAPDHRNRELHARAAAAIENRLSSQSDPQRCWATLGHHYAAARQPENAAKYLKLAADHAKQTHANSEAIRLYREAINQVNQILLRLTSEPAQWQETLVGLYEALGDVLALSARREEAREAYDRAISRIEQDRQDGGRARLLRKKGKTCEIDHRDRDAQELYGLATAILRDTRSHSRAATREWIEIELDKLYGYYFMRRVGDMDATVSKLRTTVEAHGSPSQRARFFQVQMMLNMRRERYVVSEETLEFAKAAVMSCNQDSSLLEFPLMQFGHGFALLFHHSYLEAEQELQIALGLAERAGDLALQARCLAYLSTTTRMLGLADRTRELADRCADISSVASTREYLGAAWGNRAWITLQERDFEGSDRTATAALEVWSKLEITYSFKWLALLPLIECKLHFDDLAQAVSLAENLMAPEQHCLPDRAATAFRRSIQLHRLGSANDAHEALGRALEELKTTGYH